MVMAQEFGYTREIEDRVQAPCPIWLVAVAKVLSGATQGLIAALIVFPMASVVHASGVEAHLSVHWPIVITLIPLACVTMTALGLLLGTAFEARNLGLMFGFVVLPLTFLGGTYYQWTKLAPVQAAGDSLAADRRAREPADLHQRGPARGPHPRVAHAALRRLPGSDRLLRDVPRARPAQVPRARAVLAVNDEQSSPGGRRGGERSPPDGHRRRAGGTEACGTPRSRASRSRVCYQVPSFALGDVCSHRAADSVVTSQVRVMVPALSFRLYLSLPCPPATDSTSNSVAGFAGFEPTSAAVAVVVSFSVGSISWSFVSVAPV